MGVAREVNAGSEAPEELKNLIEAELSMNGNRNKVWK